MEENIVEKNRILFVLFEDTKWRFVEEIIWKRFFSSRCWATNNKWGFWTLYIVWWSTTYVYAHVHERINSISTSINTLHTHAHIKKVEFQAKVQWFALFFIVDCCRCCRRLTWKTLDFLMHGNKNKTKRRNVLAAAAAIYAILYITHSPSMYSTCCDRSNDDDDGVDALSTSSYRIWFGCRNKTSIFNTYSRLKQLSVC